MKPVLAVLLALAAASTASAQGARRTSKPGAAPAEPVWCYMDHLKKPAAPWQPVRGAGALTEAEPNNSPATAQDVPIGTGTGETDAFVISGTLAAAGITPTTITTTEDDGSITLATPTGLVAGLRAAVSCTSSIAATPASGDFDFFSVNGNAGQTLTADTSNSSVDTYIVIYDAAGNEIAFDDDGGPGTLTTARVALPADGTYFVGVTNFDLQRLNDPFDSLSGPGGGSGDVGNYTVTIALDLADSDYFALNLRKGDVLGASISGGASALSILAPDGRLMFGSDGTLFLSDVSPLPNSGNAAAGVVIPANGRYLLALNEGSGSYSANVQVFRTALEGQAVGRKQILFLDFDGATINAAALWGGNSNAVLSPMANFMSGWGLTAADVSPLIDAILAVVEENLEADLAAALNGDYATTGIPGQFDIEIRNSRDHADPVGEANVSRIIVGGTQAQLGVNTIGIAESIDVGNFDTEEVAVVLLDILAQNPATSQSSVNNWGVDPGFGKVRAVAQAVGNVIAHEAGHYFGCYHTDQFNASPQLMDQGGNPRGTFGVGADGNFGTADDVDVDFLTDTFNPNEGYLGQEDTKNTIAFGLSTGRVGAPSGDKDVWTLF